MAKKYIDAEKLKAEIDKLIDDAPSYDYSKVYLLGVCSIIDSLQEEQPEADLEKEIADYWTATEWCQIMTLSKFKVIARYFYGLGLKARKVK